MTNSGQRMTHHFLTISWLIWRSKRMPCYASRVALSRSAGHFPGKAQALTPGSLHAHSSQGGQPRPAGDRYDQQYLFSIPVSVKLSPDEARWLFGCHQDDSGAEAIAIVRRYFDRSIAVHVRIRTSCIKSEAFHSLSWRLAGATIT